MPSIIPDLPADYDDLLDRPHRTTTAEMNDPDRLGGPIKGWPLSRSEFLVALRKREPHTPVTIMIDQMGEGMVRHLAQRLGLPSKGWLAVFSLCFDLYQARRRLEAAQRKMERIDQLLRSYRLVDEMAAEVRELDPP
jgi:hypothetical protein